MSASNTLRAVAWDVDATLVGSESGPRSATSAGLFAMLVADPSVSHGWHQLAAHRLPTFAELVDSTLRITMQQARILPPLFIHPSPRCGSSAQPRSF